MGWLQFEAEELKICVSLIYRFYNDKRKSDEVCYCMQLVMTVGEGWLWQVENHAAFLALSPFLRLWVDCGSEQGSWKYLYRWHIVFLIINVRLMKFVILCSLLWESGKDGCDNLKSMQHSSHFRIFSSQIGCNFVTSTVTYQFLLLN